MQTVIGKLMRSAPALSLVTNFIVDGVIEVMPRVSEKSMNRSVANGAPRILKI